MKADEFCCLKFVSFCSNINVGVDLLANKHGFKSLVFSTLNVLNGYGHTILNCTILKYIDEDIVCDAHWNVISPFQICHNAVLFLLLSFDGRQWILWMMFRAT